MSIFNRAALKSKSLGQLGEEYGQKIYKSKGYKILGANIFNRRGKRMGEIDFIAVGRRDIAFVEVKTRSQENNKFGNIREAVDEFKQFKILKVVKLFLIKNQYYRKLRPHIDILSIIWPDIDKKPEKVILSSNAVEDTF